ncbi:MAG TPA: AMP-binding protein [Candidatus Eremiobacteraceae bacterium]|nr:AMP-binding protein [Candidatus Eremiobacteraceae bacterium]
MPKKCDSTHRRACSRGCCWCACSMTRRPYAKRCGANTDRSMSSSRPAEARYRHSSSTRRSISSGFTLSAVGWRKSAASRARCARSTCSRSRRISRSGRRTPSVKACRRSSSTPAEARCSARRVTSALGRMQPDVLIGVPGFVYHMLRQAASEGVRLTKLVKVALGGERVPLGLRSKIGELCAQMGAPDVRVQSVLGFTEARHCWAECMPPDHETSYGFHTYPDLEIFECVDPDTDELVGPGERGELVYTALEGRGSCVIRYKTGDIAENGIVYDPCPGCGRIVPRVSTTLSRRSDVGEFQLTKIRGTLVDLNNFLPAMASIDEVVEWQVVVRKKDGEALGLDEIVLSVALRDDVDPEAVKRKITARLLAEMEVAPNVIEVLPLAQLTENLGLDTQMKEWRIRDLRAAATNG